ncbi:MAG: glutaminase [Crocinitomicaceae bacterium]
MDFSKVLFSLFHEIKALDDPGKQPSYIPELTHVDPNKFGIHISTIENFHSGVGDFQERFSIQSIAKVLALSLAYRMQGEKIWERIGVEPSGTPFNSLVQLEADKGIPRNPFINAGALVISDLLISSLKNPKDEFLAFVRDAANNFTIDYSNKIAESEKTAGFRNVALCNFIKALGNIQNDPNEVLDFYFHLCSIEMSCEELSQLYLFLANNGMKLNEEKEVLTANQCKRVNALMQTCGFYDESGEFAFKVGLPGKSGVGGGIIAVHPNQYAIAVWSPKLNPKGNSFKGMQFLEAFTTKTHSSIF